MENLNVTSLRYFLWFCWI